MASTTATHAFRTDPTLAVTFIERDLAEIDGQLRALQPSLETVLLEAGEPVPVQMARILAGRAGVPAVYWISQGEGSAMRFSRNTLCAAEFDEYTEAWKQIGDALADRGSLALWRCKTTHGESAQALIQTLTARA